MGEFWELFLERRGEVWTATLEHLDMTLTAVALAVLFAVPLGIYISRERKVSGSVLGVAGVIQTIPSLALLGFMLTLLGIGWEPAVVALFLYSLLPILRNTFTALNEVDPALKEAARGMGMSSMQALVKVEIPLSLPVIMAGIRTAAVITIGIATLCALIGAGGLGKFIFRGIALNNSGLILLGVIPSAALALIIDFILGRVEKLLVPKGLRIGKQ